MKPILIAAAFLGFILSGCGPLSYCVQQNVEPTAVTLAPTESVQASYHLYSCESQGTQIVETTPVWTSADPEIATVSETGVITAQLEGGSTTVTVSAPEYNISATIPVDVSPPATAP